MQYTIIVPIKNPIIQKRFLVLGNISSRTTYNMVPAAIDRNTPIKELKFPAKYTPKKLPIPIGIPAITVYSIILLVFILVPARVSAVASPSGTLCMPITKANVHPRVSADTRMNQ